MAGLDEASAAYREAQKNFERQQSLVQRQLVSASQFDIQRALRDAAKGRLDQIRAQLSDRVIAAPFDGVLGLRLVSPGSLVTPGTVITTLTMSPDQTRLLGARAQSRRCRSARPWSRPAMRFRARSFAVS